MSISQKVCVKLEGSKAVWMLQESSVVKVDGVSFAKVNPRDRGLINMIVMKSAVKTMLQLKGFNDIIKLRNDAQRDVFNSETKVCPIFKVQAKTIEKFVRRPRSQLAELRKHLGVREIKLPPNDSIVKVLRPVHPCDELYIQLDCDMLKSAIDFIVTQGIDDASISPKRSYNKDAAGVWKCGSAGLVRPGDGGIKRFKCLKDPDREDDGAQEAGSGGDDHQGAESEHAGDGVCADASGEESAPQSDTEA